MNKQIDDKDKYYEEETKGSYIIGEREKIQGSDKIEPESNELEKQEKPDLTKRIPRRNRQKADECYHRLPIMGTMLVMDQLDVYYRVDAPVEIELTA